MTRGSKIVWALIGSLVAIQLVPYGHDHANPTASKEPAWDAPRTRALAVRACFDCHSNETKWPWYAHVAPMSWLVLHHVEDGRKHLNFSRWDRPQKHGDDCADAVSEGWMPLDSYVWLHPDARLGGADKADLEAGFVRMFGRDDKPGE